jgi:hypothetical protein
MSGYKTRGAPQEQNDNVADAVIDGGDALTTYNIAFDNGSATAPAEVPVRLDFGAAT